MCRIAASSRARTQTDQPLIVYTPLWPLVSPYRPDTELPPNSGLSDRYTQSWEISRPVACHRSRNFLWPRMLKCPISILITPLWEILQPVRMFAIVRTTRRASPHMTDHNGFEVMHKSDGGVITAITEIRCAYFSAQRMSQTECFRS